MSAAKELIKALRASYVPWMAYEGQLTAVWQNLGQIMVRTDGRTFVISPFHNGEWRWFWPWTRRKVARAARERYDKELKQERTHD